MISANGGLRAHRYTPQVTQRWPRGSEPASARDFGRRANTNTCGAEFHRRIFRIVFVIVFEVYKDKRGLDLG